MPLPSNPPRPAPSANEIRHIKLQKVYELVLASVRSGSTKLDDVSMSPATVIRNATELLEEINKVR